MKFSSRINEFEAQHPQHPQHQANMTQWYWVLVLPVNFSMRDCVSLKVKETDIVVVKKTKRVVISTPHFDTI